MTKSELEAIATKVDKATGRNWLTDFEAFRYANQVVVEDVPKLLAEIDRLKLENERLQDDLDSEIEHSANLYELLEMSIEWGDY